MTITFRMDMKFSVYKIITSRFPKYILKNKPSMPKFKLLKFCLYVNLKQYIKKSHKTKAISATIYLTKTHNFFQIN